ncbi:hypothetical protein Tco_0537879 [Tanacetum coccineum]
MASTAEGQPVDMDNASMIATTFPATDLRQRLYRNPHVQPLVLRWVLEILTYLATNHSSVANVLFYFDSSLVPESLNFNYHDKKNDKGKEKVIEGGEISQPVGSEGDIPILSFVKLLNQPPAFSTVSGPLFALMLQSFKLTSFSLF